MQILLASGNAHKISEFRALAGADFDLLAPRDLGINLEVAETGATYFENALLKARAYANASGMPVLADDSGIEVDALDGAPGIFSARFGDSSLTDEGRVQLLLDRLAGVPPAQRTARYQCVLVVALPGGQSWSAAGSCEGLIGSAPRGENGFGYDPVFVLAGLDRAMAEISSDEKHGISHRGRAYQALREVLAEAGADWRKADDDGLVRG